MANRFLLLQYGIIGVAIFVSALAMIKLIIEPLIVPYTGFEGPSGILIDVPILKPIYDVSPYILPAAWGAVAGTVVWKGKIRSRWKKEGYDYDIFRLVTKMRGSPKRIQLLRLLNLPKNKSQLAKELEVDWRTIDNHIQLLMRNSLIEEMAMVGTSTYYIVSERGKKVLFLLSDNEERSSDDQSHTNS